MKLSKALLLLSVFALVACGSQKSSSVSESKENTSSVETSAMTTSEETSYVTSTIESTTSEVVTSSTTSTSTQPVVTENTVTVNLYNPSCGTFSTEVLNDRLATYMNSLVTTPFVESITNTKTQIANNIPTSGNSVLIIGAAESVGSLSITFTNTIKKVSITAQTYHKPYTQTWVNPPVEVSNVDDSSALRIAGKGSDPVQLLDLAPAEDQPVEKSLDINLNHNKLTLSSANEDHGRVFIKSLTFVY